MADRVIERTEVTEPRETVVVHDRDDRVVDDRGSNTGVIIAVVVLALILLALLFGRGMFGSGSTATPSVPSTSTSTGGAQ